VAEGVVQFRSTVCFDRFEVSADGEIRKDGVPFPLQEQPLRILLRLLEKPGHIVTREELRQELWPADTFVDFDHGVNAAIRRLRDALGDSADAPRFVETIPRHGYRFVGAFEARPSDSDRNRRLRRIATVTAIAVAAVALMGKLARRPDESAATIQSIAVLPFQNLTGDPQQEYFVDGLTDAIGAELSHSASTRVVSGTTTARYKSAGKTVHEIAAELGGVDGLVEGSVMRTGQHVRVDVALVDARNDRRLWAESYDRDLGDVLSLYADLGHAMAVELHRATNPVHPATDGDRPIDPIAYDAFLQGVYFTRRWQAGGCPTAEPFLQRAVAIDPTFSDAYAYLAFCYVVPDRMRRPGWESGPQARVAAAKALALDGQSGFAHAMQAWVKWRLDFEWDSAAREIEHALALNPGNSDVQMTYGEWLYLSGRPEDGLRAIREALRLNPLSLDHQTAYGFALRSVRRFDAAVDQLRLTLQRDPTWTIARFWLAYTDADRGQRASAVNEYLRFLEDVFVPDRVAALRAELAASYATQGWEAFWRHELELAEEDNRAPGSVWRHPHSYYSGPFSMARRYARLGDSRGALRWLQSAYVYRHHLMVTIDCEPLFDRLRGEPQYEQLRRLVGLRH
jgi:TolB-like protein/Tfp pilus assembly protein PilF